MSDLIFLIFNILMYMGVYDGIKNYLKLFEGTLRYMKVYKHIWTHFVYIVFFQLFGGTLFRHCFFSTFRGSSYSTLFFFNFLGVHCFDIVFFPYFVKGLQASGGISSFFSWNFTSNGGLNLQKGWILVHAMTWRCVSEPSQGFWYLI